MIYPLLMYRCPGIFGCQGGSYSCFAVESFHEQEVAISQGWFPTLAEAISGLD